MDLTTYVCTFNQNLSLTLKSERLTAIKVEHGLYACTKLSKGPQKIEQITLKSIYNHDLTHKSASCKACKCSKTNCLNFYCSCFAANVLCDSCFCINCKNNIKHNKERQEAVERLNRNKRKTDENEGCKCSKTGCVKNYCPCFVQNKKCGKNCVCVSCMNAEVPRSRVLSIEKSELCVLNDEVKTAENSKSNAQLFFEMSQVNQSSLLFTKRNRSHARNLFEKDKQQPDICSSLGLFIQRQGQRNQPSLLEKSILRNNGL